MLAQQGEQLGMVLTPRFLAGETWVGRLPRAVTRPGRPARKVAIFRGINIKIKRPVKESLMRFSDELKNFLSTSNSVLRRRLGSLITALITDCGDGSSYGFHHQRAQHFAKQNMFSTVNHCLGAFSANNCDCISTGAGSNFI